MSEKKPDKKSRKRERKRQKELEEKNEKENRMRLEYEAHRAQLEQEKAEKILKREQEKKKIIDSLLNRTPEEAFKEDQQLLVSMFSNYHLSFIVLYDFILKNFLQEKPLTLPPARELNKKFNETKCPICGFYDKTNLHPCTSNLYLYSRSSPERKLIYLLANQYGLKTQARVICVQHVSDKDVYWKEIHLTKDRYSSAFSAKEWRNQIQIYFLTFTSFPLDIVRMILDEFLDSFEGQGQDIYTLSALSPCVKSDFQKTRNKIIRGNFEKKNKKKAKTYLQLISS